MNNLDVRYAKTPSGRNVAFGVSGTGPLVLSTPGSITTGDFINQPFHDCFLAHRDRIRFAVYSHIGGGPSEREGYDFSPAGLLAELECVVESLGETPVALFGAASGSHTVVRYAIKHPENVSCIVLQGWARGKDYVSGPAFAAYRRAANVSWEVASEYFAIMQGHARREEVATQASLVRQTTSYGAFLDFLAALEASDVTSLLPEVRVPTLVTHLTNHIFAPIELAKSLATGIPGAVLQSFDSKPAVYVAAVDFVLSRARSVEFPVERAAPACPSSTGSAVLTGREQEVLELLAAGKTNREIGDLLVIAEATATRHVHNILTKLGLSNRVEAATWWARNAPSRSEAETVLQGSV